MEFLVCLWIASMLTGIRPFSDMVHALKGQEPPHLAKARLRAAQQAERLAAKQAAAEKRKVRPGEGKPTLADVLGVYWGDAMADAISSHNQRRVDKAKRREAAATGTSEPSPGSRRPGRIARFAKLLWEGSGAAEAATAPAAKVGSGIDAEAAVNEALDPGPRITCDECGATLVDGSGGHTHPAGSTCSKTWTTGRDEDVDDITGDEFPPPAPAQAAPEPPARAQAPRVERQPIPSVTDQERRADRDRLLTDISDAYNREDYQGAADAIAALKARFPAAANSKNVGVQVYDPATGSSRPALLSELEADIAQRLRADATEGDDMTTPTPTTSTATGDAHDVETALHQCGLLHDDLVRIDTALDVIDEAIINAGTAAELIEAFLASKSVDDSAVGGMATARERLSPEHIKTLIDAVDAAKQGVRAAEDELRRLQELESQLNGADGSVLNGR